MAPPKRIDMDPTPAPQPAPEKTAAQLEADEINAQIAADFASKVKSRAFSDAVTVGKAGLFDVSKYSNGLDYTVGGNLEVRWCADNEVNIANKRQKGFMLPAEVSGHLRNIKQNGLVLMVRTKQAADAHRAQVEALSKNLDGQEFENSTVLEQAKRLHPKSKSPFRDFEKIEAT